jgi:hypothetical protein
VGVVAQRRQEPRMPVVELFEFVGALRGQEL